MGCKLPVMAKTLNDISLKSLRRRLRINPAQPEILLWTKLRGRQILNSKFRRQCSIGRYVVDFYCPSARLVIEIDGDTHFVSKEAVDNDSKRQQFIESKGMKVLRFTNSEVSKNMTGVLKTIEDYILSITPHPNPLLKEERE